VIDCCTREIVGWNLSDRCRTEAALAAVEQAVLERLPQDSRELLLTLTTDNGTQFTSSRFLETLARLGITHRRTAYHHPEGNSYIERFHRSLKEEEVWTAEDRSVEEARTSIARWIEEYNHDQPHRGVQNRTPHEAFLAFAGVLKTKAWLSKLAGALQNCTTTHIFTCYAAPQQGMVIPGHVPGPGGLMHFAML
jgi:transposase InsO family protein